MCVTNKSNLAYSKSKIPLKKKCNDFSIISPIILQGKAHGNRYALWLRSKLQDQFFGLGCFVQRSPGTVLFFGTLLLSVACVGLKWVDVESNMVKLWVEGKQTEPDCSVQDSLRRCVF